MTSGNGVEKVRIIKQTPSKLQKLFISKPLLKVITFLVITFGYITLKISEKKTLVESVTNLQKNSNCDNGLKELAPVAKHLESTKYTNTEREKTYKYLMLCYTLKDNRTKALAYAQKLHSLYDLEGNSTKQHDLSATVQYIKASTK